MFFHQPSNSLSANNYNACFYRNEKWDFHFHKNFEIIYVIEGSVTCTVNSSTQKLSPGDFGLCLSNDIHSYEPCENALYWVCVFSADYVRTFSKQVMNKDSRSFKFKCSSSVECFIKDNLISEDTPPINMLKACLYALCNEYINSVELIDKNTSKTHSMTAIVDFVSSHHTENIKLDDISKLLGLDYHYVSRYFKKVFNMSFTVFLNSYRLETAIGLLDESNKKIVDIAYESGFQSVRAFNECFKRTFKISPSEYKKQSTQKSHVN